MTRWQLDVLTAIRETIAEKDLITVDDIHPLVVEPTNWNQWGKAFSEAKRRGLIEEAGYVKSKRPESKGRRVLQWRRAESRQGALI